MLETIGSKALHYLYFPNEVAGRAAAKEIARCRLQSEVRLSADEANWLVLVQHNWPMTQSEFDGIETQLKRIAAAHSGEYDGWEVPER